MTPDSDTLARLIGALIWGSLVVLAALYLVALAT